MTEGAFATLRQAVRSTVDCNKIEILNEDFDPDGDYFYDFIFKGERGNQYRTRLILRHEQLIVVTQLPIHVPVNTRRDFVDKVSHVNRDLAVGAFTMEEGYVIYRSGFNLTPKPMLSPEVVFLTLMSNVELTDHYLPTFLRAL